MKRTCKECGNEFDITQSEIRFYKSKHLALPRRCKDCRDRKKQQSDGEAEKALPPAQKNQRLPEGEQPDSGKSGHGQGGQNRKKNHQPEQNQPKQNQPKRREQAQEEKHLTANANSKKQDMEGSKSRNLKETQEVSGAARSKEKNEGMQEAAVKDPGKATAGSVSQTTVAKKTEKGTNQISIFVLCLIVVLAIGGLLYLWISGSQGNHQSTDTSSYEMDHPEDDTNQAVEEADEELSDAGGSLTVQQAEEWYPEEDEWQEEVLTDDLSDDLSDFSDFSDDATGTEYDAQEEKEDAVTYDDVRQVYFRSEKLLNQHYQKHGIAMGFDTAKEYEEAAAAVVNNPEALHKLEAEDGDDVYYVESTNEFVVVSTDGYIRTYFNPDIARCMLTVIDDDVNYELHE